MAADNVTVPYARVSKLLQNPSDQCALAPWSEGTYILTHLRTLRLLKKDARKVVDSGQTKIYGSSGSCHSRE
jgi:hypothetical protein